MEISRSTVSKIQLSGSDGAILSYQQILSGKLEIFALFNICSDLSF